MLWIKGNNVVNNVWVFIFLAGEHGKILVFQQFWALLYTLNKIINATLLCTHVHNFICTQNAYFSQILFTNLSKSVLVSTSLPR